MTYTVKFTKTFTDGNLKGITFPSSLSFAALDAAKKYVDFLNEHGKVPYIVPKWAGTGSWICTYSEIKVGKDV